jgi:hypothetical protein
VCQAELDALHQRVARLKALPSLHPPRDRWPAIQQGFQAERRRILFTRARWITGAVAASFALVIGTQVVRQRPPDGMAREAVASENLQSLVSQSQQLEAALREYRPENRVVNGAVAGAVAELEDRIATIDEQLGRRGEWNASQHDVTNLWRRRVELMQGLVNVHVTRAAYLGM